MNLALRDIRYSLLRFLLTAIGLGLLTAGTLTINGIYNGVVVDALNIVERIDADLWIVEEGTGGPLAESSQVSADLVGRVEGVEGIARTRRFDTLAATTERSGRDVDITLLALDYPTDNGQWLPLVAGRPIAVLRGEAIADATSGFKVGATMAIDGETVRVVGLTSGMVETNGEPVIALSAADFDAIRLHPKPVEEPARGAGNAARLWPHATTTAAVIANLAPSADPLAVAARIDRFGDASVLTSDEQRDLIVNGRLSRMRLQILLFSGLLTLITAVVVTLTIYTMTVEKQHTIALLKLIGASNWMVSGLIVSQAMVLAILGIVAGLGLEHLLAPLFPRRVLLTVDNVAIISATLVLTCMIGSGLGLFKAMKVRAQEILS